MTTITDTTVNPVLVPTSKTATPFSLVTVSDPLQTTETVTVTLNPWYYYSPGTDIGTLTDPMGGGSFDPATHTFTEAAIVTATPTPATEILHRLIYAPPKLSNGTSINVGASINVNGATDPTTILLETVTPPAITATNSNEPVASGAGNTIHPFGIVQIADNNLSYNYRYYFSNNPQTNATITLTDGGAPTDADGLLTGPGLGKSGVGTYTLPTVSNYQLQSYLQQLVFTPTAVAAGGNRTTAFELNVTDTGTALSTDDKATSVLTIGPIPSPQPLIAGAPGGQTVAPGNIINPFHGITISDSGANPLDSATLTVTGGGTLSGVSLTPGAAGIYTIAALSPSQLTDIVSHVTFTPPPLGGQSSIETKITLDVADGGVHASIDAAITEIAPSPPPSAGGNFSITNQTTGQQVFASGDAYTGPVAGIDRELIQITPDNLNITSSIPNVFIHSGSGMDGLNVSMANGNNILDGFTGSNFLTGGTGKDTFYLDNRNPTSPIFSTVVNFHAGDNVTVWGVNATDFKTIMLDNQGAEGFKGLDLLFSAPGHLDTSFVLTGYTSADLTNGRLSQSYGTTSDLPGLPGSQYLTVHAN